MSRSWKCCYWNSKSDCIIPGSHAEAPWEALGAGALASQLQVLTPVAAANLLMCICSLENAVNLLLRWFPGLSPTEEIQDPGIMVQRY